MTAPEPATRHNELASLIQSQWPDFVPLSVRYGAAEAADEMVRAWFAKPVPSAAEVAALVESLQSSWNAWCSDTGCWPDWLQRRGRDVMEADFSHPSFYPFARAALEAVRGVGSEERT